MPKFLSQVDLSKIPVKGLIPESGPTAPASPVNGQLWYDTSVGKLKAYQAGAWVALDLDTNTVYTSGTAAMGIIGTDTTDRVWSPLNIYGTIKGIFPTGTAAQISTGTDTTPQVWKAADLKTASMAASPVQSVSGRTGAVTLAKADVGLGNVDNTADTAKPVSTAQQTAINAKADLAGPTFTGNPKAVTPTNGDNSTNLATTAFVTTAVSGKANSASPTFTGVVTVPTPTNATDAANKSYVDGMVQGLDAKGSVQAGTTGNITLSGTQTIDGIAVVAGNRVLVKDQTQPSQNGIYTVASGAWARSSDADLYSELVNAFTFVEEGFVNGDTGWVANAPSTGTLNTSSIPWVQFSAAGVVEAGAGMYKTGAQIGIALNGVTSEMLHTGAVDFQQPNLVTGVLPVANGGTGADNRIAARQLMSALAAKKFPVPATTAGTWVSLSDTQPYNALPQVKFYEEATWEEVVMDVRLNNTSLLLQVRSDVALTAGVYSALVQSADL